MLDSSGYKVIGKQENIMEQLTGKLRKYGWKNHSGNSHLRGLGLGALNTDTDEIGSRCATISPGEMKSTPRNQTGNRTICPQIKSMNLEMFHFCYKLHETGWRVSQMELRLCTAQYCVGLTDE